MQKKYCLLILAFIFMLGTTAASLLPVKSHPDSTGVYIYVDPHIYPGTAGAFILELSIDSPDAWDNTASGIVGWALSVRVDPSVLTIHAIGARKAQPEQPTAGGAMPGGFLESFLVRHSYNTYDFLGWTINYPTNWYIGENDPTTGTILDVSEQIEKYSDLGVGAGGGPYTLCEVILVDADGNAATDPSVIDLFGPPRPPIIEIEPMWLGVDGVWHSADVVTDGYYIGETPDITMFELISTASVIGSTWHEVWPEPCREWSLDSWDDNTDGVLSESDQIDMTLLETGYKAWYHVEWVNPDPVAGDGKADLIVKFKEPYPEFPLGLEIMMMIAAAIPIIYIWRTRKWAGKK